MREGSTRREPADGADPGPPTESFEPEASSNETTWGAKQDGHFATTQWRIILAAQQKSQPGAQEALETLCRAYWYPLYVFVRREGFSPEDAQDLTQGFFAKFLAKDYLADVAEEKGRFRSFL